MTAIGELSWLLGSTPVITIRMTEAMTVFGNSMMLLGGIPCSKILVNLSQLFAASIRTLLTGRMLTLFTVSGVPIFTLVILAVPPKLNLRYSGQANPSLNAGDHAGINLYNIMNYCRNIHLVLFCFLLTEHFYRTCFREYGLTNFDLFSLNRIS